MAGTTQYDDLAERAADVLAGTESAWIRWSDDRYGKTVAGVVAGEVGDPVGESNVIAASRILAEYIADGTAEEFTVGRSGRTWLRGVAVTVLDDDGNVTAAFAEAVDIIDRLDGYPLLDDDLFSELEYESHYESLRLDYGDAVDLVVDAVLEHGRWSLGDVIGDHDEVVECVEAYLAAGNGPDEVVLHGLRYYIDQRKNDLDIPTLAALAEQQ